MPLNNESEIELFFTDSYFLGTLGFIGNCVIFLHPTIRRNTCSIYSLCGTITDELDLLIDYLAIYGYTLPS